MKRLVIIILVLVSLVGFVYYQKAEWDGKHTSLCPPTKEAVIVVSTPSEYVSHLLARGWKVATAEKEDVAIKGYIATRKDERIEITLTIPGNYKGSRHPYDTKAIINKDEGWANRITELFFKNGEMYI